MVIAWFLAMRYKEQTGYWPCLEARKEVADPEIGVSSSQEQERGVKVATKSGGAKGVLMTVRSTTS